MKVWYILMTFPSPSETFVSNDVGALARMGVDVSAHALRGPRRDAARLLEERGLAGVTVTHATPRNLLRGVAAMCAQPLRAARLARWVALHSGGRTIHLARGLALLPRVFGLLRSLERENPDVVHIYWGHYPSIFGHLVLEHAPGVVVSLSLSAYDLLRGFPGSAAVARRAHLVSTWAAANVPAIAALGLPPGSVHVSWQGVDLDKVRGRRFEKVAHRIVTAGRLIVDKGMDDVLRAFASVARAYADAELVVLGDGPDRNRLQRLAVDLGIGGRVVFRGHVAHEDVFEELARAEIFLFLSRYRGERLPNVVKEAMACRCLVITTRTPGIEELLEDGLHGRTVPQGECEQAAELIAAAFADPESAGRMAIAGQRHVFERFELLQLMDRMMRKWAERGDGRRPGATSASEGARPGRLPDAVTNPSPVRAVQQRS